MWTIIDILLHWAKALLSNCIPEELDALELRGLCLPMPTQVVKNIREFLHFCYLLIRILKKKKSLGIVFGHIHLHVYCFAMLVRSNHHPNQQFLVRHFIKLLSHDLHYSVLKLEASFLIHIKYLLTLECVRKTIWGLCLVYRDCSPATFL